MDASEHGFDKSLAVVIGIDHYGHGIPVLNTAVADARRVGQILDTSHGYAVQYLLDEAASRDALTRLFTEQLPKQLGPDDRLFVYYPGLAMDGDEGPNGYLLPHDAERGEESTFLHMPLLHDALLELNCRHLLVVFDSCFSGAFRWSATRDAIALPSVIHQERYNRFITDPAWQVISSAAHDQKAMDELTAGSLGSRGESGAHSPFALALFEALEGAGDVVPAKTPDGVITATELYLYLEDRLQTETIEQGVRQTPRLWPLQKHDKGEYIFLVPGHELDLPPAPELTFENNPYRGLAPYEREHAQLFFGRDETIADLHGHVQGNPLTIVLGASGTGKSSLVKAGLLPQLASEAPGKYEILPIVRPGTRPLHALLSSLWSLGERTGESGDVESVLESIDAWLSAHPGHRPVLVIDQFEELVTLAPTEESRDEILDVVVQLLERSSDRFVVIVTLRSDFEPSFADTVLTPRWALGRFIIPRMELEDFRAVIEGPASQRVLYFESGDLIDELIQEVLETPGALPLLSFTLSEMYIRYVERRSDDRALKWEDYRSLGGVIGALRHRADEEFDKMGGAERDTMRLIMLRMVAMEHGSVAKRRVLRSELDYPSDEQNEWVGEVVRRLTEARLLVEGSDSTGEAYVEPAHDKLVAAWRKLLEWMKESDAGLANLHFQRRLGNDAAEWARDPRAKENRGLLWRDGARAAVLARLARKKKRAKWLNRRELDFAKASIRRWRIILQGAAAVAALIVALGAAAAWQWRESVQRERTATANGLTLTASNVASDGNLDLGRLLAVEGYRIADTPETQDFLLQIAQGLPLRALVPVSDPGAGLGTATDPRLITTERLADIRDVLQLGADVPGIALQAGDFVAIGTGDSLQVLKFGPGPATPAFAVSYPDRFTTALAVNESASHLAVAVTEPFEAGFMGGNGLLPLEPSGGGSDLYVIDTADGSMFGQFQASVKLVSALALNANGTLLAASGSNGLQIFDLLGSPDPEWEVRPGGAQLTELAFAPDGREVVGRSSDGQTRRFAIVDRAPFVKSAYGTPTRVVSFLPESTELLTFDYSTTIITGDSDPVRLWDAESMESRIVGQATRGLIDIQAPHVVQWVEDGLRYFDVDGVEPAYSFDVIGTLRENGALAADVEDPWAVEIATVPDGKLAAVVLELPTSTGSSDDNASGGAYVAVLDLERGTADAKWLEHVPRLVSFTREADYVVTAGGDDRVGYLNTWRVNGNGRMGEGSERLFESPVVAMDLGWEAWAAVALRSGMVELWDLAANEARFSAGLSVGRGVTALALDDENLWLAVGREFAVELWDTESLQPVAEPFEVGLVVNSLAFDDSGDWLAAGTGDELGQLRVWHLESESLMDRICRIVGRNLLWEESYRYLYREQEDDYQCTCGGFPAPEGLQCN